MKFAFRVTVETNEMTGEIMAVYFRVRKGKVATTKEYADGAVFADYDKHGELLGLEMLSPCKVTVLDKLNMPQPALKFVKGSMPRRMAA